MSRGSWLRGLQNSSFGEVETFKHNRIHGFVVLWPSSLIMELLSTSTSSPRPSKTILWSSRTRQGALKHPPWSRSEARKDLKMLPTSFQGPSRQPRDWSLSSSARQRALQEAPRRSCGAAKHSTELSNSLHGADLKLAKTSECFQQAFKDPHGNPEIGH